MAPRQPWPHPLNRKAVRVLRMRNRDMLAILPTNASHDTVSITCCGKKLLFERDLKLLITSAVTHPSAEPFVQIAVTVSWRKIWDSAGSRHIISML